MHALLAVSTVVPLVFAAASVLLSLHPHVKVTAAYLSANYLPCLTVPYRAFPYRTVPYHHRQSSDSILFLATIVV